MRKDRISGCHAILSYKHEAAPRPVRQSLPAEDYFDPLDPGETYDVDSVPKHDHARDYLSGVGKIEWTHLRVVGPSGWRDIRTEYSSIRPGDTWLTVRRDSDGYQEMIHVTQIRSAQVHILRTFRTGRANWRVCYDGVIETLPDGSQREVTFH